MFARGIQVHVTGARKNLVSVPADLFFFGKQYIQRAHRDAFGHDAGRGIDERNAIFHMPLRAQHARLLDLEFGVMSG